MIIAVVGSGGKTTLIKKLAQQYRREGKTVLVTTTTHMFIEEDTLLTDDADRILRELREKGYAMAGIPEGEKIKALSKETYKSVSARADVVLVEADGSKHMPLKYPNASEPVIPDNAERIIVVWGPHGLQKPAREVCHRLELVLRCLAIQEDTVITAEHIAELLHKGYLQPLGQQYPHAEILVWPPLQQ
jgi:xanthine dehydrogenase accessory factor